MIPRPLGVSYSTPDDNMTSLVSIGPIARWIRSYSMLDILGVGVAGGRIHTVGTGGLLLGAGCSCNRTKQAATVPATAGF